MKTIGGLQLRRDVLLQIQVALLRMVEPSLRAVSAGWSPEAITVVMFFDGPLRQQDLEDASDVEAELMARFPEYEVCVEARRLDFPARPTMLMAWAYWRRE